MGQAQGGEVSSLPNLPSSPHGRRTIGVPGQAPAWTGETGKPEAAQLRQVTEKYLRASLGYGLSVDFFDCLA